MPRVSSNNAISDMDYVKELTSAERKARDVLEAARKRKVNRMKKAKDEAQTEIDATKKEFEDSLKSTIRNVSVNQDKSSVTIDKELKEKIITLNNAFSKNRQAVLEFVVENMLKVNPEVHQNLPNA